MKNWIHSETKSGDIVLFTKVELFRNLKGQKFVKYISEEEARNIAEKVYNKLSSKDEKLNFLKSWESSKNELNYYKDKEIASDKLIERKNKSAIIINEDETLSIILNEEEHIKIQGITAGFEIEETYKIVNAVDDLISKDFSYEFDKEYGYLTSNIKNLGTGLNISMVVHLPALKANNRIKDVKESLKDDKVSVEELYKDSNLYVVKNKVTLGMSEEQILEGFKEAVYYLIKEEKRNRDNIILEKSIYLKDKVYRAYGILTYAKMIGEDESLKLLSDIRMGVEMSILDISKALINEAFIKSRNSSIQRDLKEILSKEELDYERAKIIDEIFS